MSSILPAHSEEVQARAVLLQLWQLQSGRQQQEEMSVLQVRGDVSGYYYRIICPALCIIISPKVQEMQGGGDDVQQL